jgi:hypothetical protein
LLGTNRLPGQERKISFPGSSMGRRVPRPAGLTARLPGGAATESRREVTSGLSWEQSAPRAGAKTQLSPVAQWWSERLLIPRDAGFEPCPSKRGGAIRKALLKDFNTDWSCRWE